ncbi:MAG: hypothetical protein ACYDHH_07045 [Solirubrobacteraceae bacterium]
MTSQLAKERLAIYALIVFLVGWIVVMLAIQIVEGIEFHVGFGFHQHMPAPLVRQIGVGDSLQKMMQATNRP